MPVIQVRGVSLVYEMLGDSGPVVTVYRVGLHPEVAPFIAQLRAAEENGSNMLFLGIGAALAVYDSPAEDVQSALGAGIAKAGEAIDSGAAREVLASFVERTQAAA